ncbi:translation initiation factor IF-3 [Cellulomonas sp. PhB143]|nr:translation initiation factor IF-3 [Cellulomonas sp. PhB143]
MALSLAQDADLDLVEVAPDARPPVCKLMDYGKFKYESDMKAREARRNQSNTILKEIRFRLKIDPHDYETKKGHVVRFLTAGDKVKVMIMFRGREQSRPEMGVRLLQRLAEDVQELAFVESMPKQDGRNMTMVLGPVKKKAEAKGEQRKKQDAEEPEAPSSVVRGSRRDKEAAARAAQAAERAAQVEDEAPEVEEPAVEAPSFADQVEAAQTSVPRPAPRAAAPAPERPAPARSSAPRSSAPRSSAPRPASSRPAETRPAASRPAESRPAAPGATEQAAAPSGAPATSTPTPAAAPRPAARPKPVPAPRPSARPAPRPAPKGTTN